MFYEELVKSEAWRKLSVYAMAAFMQIAIKYKGNNKDNLSLTYKEIRWLMCEHRFKDSALSQSWWSNILRIDLMQQKMDFPPIG